MSLRNVFHDENKTQVNSNEFTFIVGYCHGNDIDASPHKEVSTASELTTAFQQTIGLFSTVVLQMSITELPAPIGCYQETDILTELGTLGGGGHRQEINVTVQIIKQ